MQDYHKELARVFAELHGDCQDYYDGYTVSGEIADKLQPYLLKLTERFGPSNRSAILELNQVFLSEVRKHSS